MPGGTFPTPPAMEAAGRAPPPPRPAPSPRLGVSGRPRTFPCMSSRMVSVTFKPPSMTPVSILSGGWWRVAAALGSLVVGLRTREGLGWRGAAPTLPAPFWAHPRGIQAPLGFFPCPSRQVFGPRCSAHSDEESRALVVRLPGPSWGGWAQRAPSHGGFTHPPPPPHLAPR